MFIEEKYFDQDKNHLLKAVQAFSKESLLGVWADQIFKSFNQQHNPMGLEDDFIIQLREQVTNCKDLLVENYDLLAAVYRLNYGDNQLAFQWDGRSHMEKFDEDWKWKYNEWLIHLCAIKEIQRPLVKFAVQGEGFNNDFLKLSIRKTILSYFKLKLKSQNLYQLSA